MIPYAVEQLQNIYSPGVMQETTGQGWVWSVSEPYAASLGERLRAAWWVLTGKAQAMIRPLPGELELVLDVAHQRAPWGIYTSVRSPTDATSDANSAIPAQLAAQRISQRELNGVQEGAER